MGIKGQWSLCCRPGKRWRVQDAEPVPPSEHPHLCLTDQHHTVGASKIKNTALPIKCCRTKNWRGDFTDVLALRICPWLYNLAQNQGDQNIRGSAHPYSSLYFHTQKPQEVPSCCHTARWEQNVLAQLLESNCRLITCAGMWAGM